MLWSSKSSNGKGYYMARMIWSNSWIIANITEEFEKTPRTYFRLLGWRRCLLVKKYRASLPCQIIWTKCGATIDGLSYQVTSLRQNVTKISRNASVKERLGLSNSNLAKSSLLWRTLTWQAAQFWFWIHQYTTSGITTLTYSTSTACRSSLRNECVQDQTTAQNQPGNKDRYK